MYKTACGITKHWMLKMCTFKKKWPWDCLHSTWGKSHSLCLCARKIPEPVYIKHSAQNLSWQMFTGLILCTTVGPLPNWRLWWGLAGYFLLCSAVMLPVPWLAGMWPDCTHLSLFWFSELIFHRVCVNLESKWFWSKDLTED